MTQDKPLMAILGVIAALVVLALGLFFIRQGKQIYLDQNTPSAVVHDYILALQKGDFQKAYSFLYEAKDKPDLFTFKQSFFSDQLGLSTSVAEVGEVQVTGGKAVVNIILTQNQSDPFGQPYRNTQQANLIQQNGAWKIQMVPYPYWGYNWYHSTVPAGKVPPITVPVPASTPAG